jgi:hypothetical protein
MKSNIDIEALRIENKWLKKRIAVLIEALEKTPQYAQSKSKVGRLNETRRAKATQS